MPAGLCVGEGNEGGTENEGEGEGVGEDIGSGTDGEGEPEGGAKTDQENSSAVKLQHLHFFSKLQTHQMRCQFEGCHISNCCQHECSSACHILNCCQQECSSLKEGMSCFFHHNDLVLLGSMKSHLLVNLQVL